MSFIIPSSLQPQPEPVGKPAHIRQRLTKRRLKASNGARKSINFPGDAIAAIAAIREREGFLTDTDAVIAAVLNYARIEE